VGGGKGPRIGVVAPSNRVDPALPGQIAALLESLPAAGRPELWFHPQCFESHGHFAGDDATRSRAFCAVANDPAFDVVWFGRGGYGSFRLIETILPELGPVARRKTYLGYSDAGALLAALYRAGIGRVAHGPMPADLARPGGAAAVRRGLAFLAGDRTSLEPGLQPRQRAAAFNITILAHLIGTPALPDLTGHVLLLEEVSEPLYRIDRALGQITSCPALRQVAGIRLGRCSAIPPNDPVFGEDEEAIVRDWCGRAGIPYLGRADIGHDADNKVVPFGSVSERPSPP